MKKSNVSVKDMAASMTPASVSQREEIKELKRLLHMAQIAQGQIDDVMSQILEANKREPPVKFNPPAILVPGKKGQPVTLTVHLTDWHIGQVTPKNMVEEFNEYNWEIAQRRVEQLANALIKFVGTIRHGYEVPRLQVLVTADMISGDIHEGLIRTNEFQAPVQAVRAGRLLSAFLSRMSGVFVEVVVDFIAPGNHDRLTRKPQSQMGGENSYGFIVGSMAEDALRDQKNLTFRLHPEMQAIVRVENRRYLISHGDGIIGTWGIPFYGIERKKMRESTSRMNMIEDKRFNKIIIGHFHTGLDHEHWFIGGSLSGTDEYDHKEGRHSKPHQTSWLVHPEHGEFAFTRWYLD